MLGPLCWAVICEAIIAALRQRATLASAGRVGFPPGAGVTRDTTSDPFWSFAFYADDSAIVATGFDVSKLVDFLARCANEVHRISAIFGLSISAKSTATVFFRRITDATETANLTVKVSDDLSIPVVSTPERLLGLRFSPDMHWTEHVDQVLVAAKLRLRTMRRMMPLLSPATARALYMGKVHSLLVYAGEAWIPSLNESDLERLERAHNAGARFITGAVKTARAAGVLAEAGLRPLRVMARLSAFRFVEKLCRRPPTCPARARFLAAPVDDTRAHHNTASKQRSLLSLFASRAPAAASQAAAVAAAPGSAAGRPTPAPLRQQLPQLQQQRCSATTTLRDWCSPLAQPREPLVPHTVDRPYAPHETGPAANVTFQLLFGAARKENLPADEQLRLNQARYDALPRPRWELWCDGSVTAASDTSDAWAAFAFVVCSVDEHGTSTEILTATGPCSPYACSYTAESHALLRGLSTFAEHIRDTPDRVPLCVITDSLSQLSCLARGPCRVDEIVPLRTWGTLLQIAALRRVSLSFVYSHCGFTPHDRVDTLAGAARDACGDVPAVWWVDAARPGRTATRNAADTAFAQSGCLRALHNLPAVGKPVRVKLGAAIPLYRLRTGVDHDLGGWRHDAHDHCPRCGAPLTRDAGGVTGVEHFLSCQAPFAVALRQRIFSGSSGAPELGCGSGTPTRRAPSSSTGRGSYSRDTKFAAASGTSLPLPQHLSHQTDNIFNNGRTESGACPECAMLRLLPSTRVSIPADRVFHGNFEKKKE